MTASIYKEKGTSKQTLEFGIFRLICQMDAGGYLLEVTANLVHLFLIYQKQSFTSIWGYSCDKEVACIYLPVFSKNGKHVS